MAEWWYTDNGKKTGPIGVEDVRRLLLAGKITGSTMFWREGMDSWKPLNDVSELAGLRSAVPPPIPPKAELDPSALPIATPWPRFFARIFDLWAEVLILGF